MKKSLLIVGLIVAALAAVPLAGAATIYNSVIDFSGTQGANGWSYASVHFTDVSNLVANQALGTYSGGLWYTPDPGGPALRISATQQEMREGDSYYTLRYWTAGQAYSSVDVTSTFYATVEAGAFVYFYNASTASQTLLTGAFSTLGGIAAGGGTEVIALNNSLTNVAAGSRIYFAMQNAGGSGGFTLQTWDQTITVPEPAALSLLLLGGLTLARRRR